MSKKEVLEAERLTMSVFNDYYCRLRLLAVSRYQWLNLPTTCDERFLEKTLCDDGRAIFIKDKYEGLGFLNLRMNDAGSYNVYRNPTHYRAYSINYSYDYLSSPEAKECVRIRNNYLDLTTDFTLQLFAKRLCEAELTAGVNVIAQKTPILILCPEEDRLTVENLYMKFVGNMPIIKGEQDLLSDKLFTVLKTDAPYIADKMYEHKHNIWNEALDFLGIPNNSNQDKKERVNTSEVEVNNGYTGLQGETSLLARKQACKEINEMFSDQFEKPIDVKLREYEIPTTEDDTKQEEGDDNE